MRTLNPKMSDRIQIESQKRQPDAVDDPFKALARLLARKAVATLTDQPTVTGTVH